MTAPPLHSTPRRQVGASPATRHPVAAISVIGGDDFDRNVWCVAGLPIDAIGVSATAEAIAAAARDRRRLSFVTPNVNWLVRALADPSARLQVINADLSLADGAPVVAIARFLGAPIGERAAGADVFEALRLRPGFAGRRLRVFFLGGRDGSAEAAHAAIARSPGGVEAVGWLNPGFGDVASMSGDAVIAKINAAQPDFVVVALGAAKGQAWIEANAKRLAAPVIAHLGAVVDFTAGTVTRAPRWLARAGLEWAWRIGQEPALLQRYVADALGLAKIISTRVAPQLLLARLSVFESDESAEAVVRCDADGAVIRLSGALVSPALAPVRTAFREAAEKGRPVILDFSRVRRVDRAFLGLVLMLEKNMPTGALRLSGVSRRLRSLFAVNAMRYPIVKIAPSSRRELLEKAAVG